MKPGVRMTVAWGPSPFGGPPRSKVENVGGAGPSASGRPRGPRALPALPLREGRTPGTLHPMRGQPGFGALGSFVNTELKWSNILPGRNPLPRRTEHPCSDFGAAEQLVCERRLP